MGDLEAAMTHRCRSLPCSWCTENFATGGGPLSLVQSEVLRLRARVAELEGALRETVETIEEHVADGAQERGMELRCAMGFSGGEVLADKLRNLLDGGTNSLKATVSELQAELRRVAPMLPTEDEDRVNKLLDGGGR